MGPRQDCKSGGRSAGDFSICAAVFHIGRMHAQQRPRAPLERVENRWRSSDCCSVKKVRPEAAGSIDLHAFGSLGRRAVERVLRRLPYRRFYKEPGSSGFALGPEPRHRRAAVAVDSSPASGSGQRSAAQGRSHCTGHRMRLRAAADGNPRLHAFGQVRPRRSDSKTADERENGNATRSGGRYTKTGPVELLLPAIRQSPSLRRPAQDLSGMAITVIRPLKSTAATPAPPWSVVDVES